MKKTLLFAVCLSVFSGIALAEDTQYYERVAVKKENGETKHYFKKVSLDKGEVAEESFKGFPVSSNSNGIYVSLKGGISNAQVKGANEMVAGLDVSDSLPLAAVAVGAKVNNFRFEIEGTYRDKQDLLLGYDGYEDEYVISDIQSHGAMLNGYYDMPTGTKFTPFVMVGVGFSKNKIGSSVEVDEYNEFITYREGWEKGDSTEFAYSFGAGFSYQVSDNLNFDMAYRYVDLGSAEIKAFDERTSIREADKEYDYRWEKLQKYDLKSNEFLAGIRYTF